MMTFDPSTWQSIATFALWAVFQLAVLVAIAPILLAIDE